jgi:hypothetical protein
MQRAGGMIQLLSPALLWFTLLFLSFAVQQLMKQMRADVDSKRELKLAKQQFVWTLWPEHRQLFPQSRLRKCHFLLILGAITVIAALLFSRITL